MSSGENGEADFKVVLRDFEKDLRKQLGKDIRVKSFITEPLTKAGDNYGSTLLKVRAKIVTNNDRCNNANEGEAEEKEEELNLVAKMLPPTKVQREIFESDLTFRKEIFVYETLLPAYENIYGGAFDIVPKFYGSRLSSKDDSDEVGEDAVILLENLKLEGYYMAERFKGLDREHLRMAVSSIAKFHAVGMSIKTRMPSLLSLIEKYAKPMSVDCDPVKNAIGMMLQAVKDDPRLNTYYDRIKSTGDLKNMTKYHTKLELTDPWACIVHNDFWLNNMMFHKNDRGIIDNVKIVDFQTFYTSSPLTDLIFLLCTSSAMPMSDFDDTLEFYRTKVKDILSRLGCDTLVLEKERFYDRLKIDASSELYHILEMVKVVEMREGEVYERNMPNEYCMKRVRRIVEIFVEKEWI